MADHQAWERAFHQHLAHTSAEPIGIVVDHAQGCWLWDPDGNRYLDLLAGIGVANVGHAHPEVVAAAGNQNRRHHHAMVYGEYIQEHQALYAAELAQAAPAPLDRVYFVNSGAEAVEGALKLARKVTGRPGLVCFEGAYHGDTLGALSMAGTPVYKKPFEPLLPGVTVLPFGDAEAAGGIDDSVAAVIVEPVQGEGGVRIPPPDFLPALREACNRAGALLIFDEVMTGFGRTGKMFALEHWGVVPDVLVLAKAMGGGYPLGAFLAAEEHMRTLADNPPLSHVTTFGGHPVSCAAGRAALAVLKRDGLAKQAAENGDRWADHLCRDLLPLDGVRDIRGLGLMVGIELDKAAAAERVTRACRDRGLLLGWTLHHDNILRLVPPLVTPWSELDRASRTLRDLLKNA